jgi:hypothetical protein
VNSRASIGTKSLDHAPAVLSLLSLRQEEKDFAYGLAGCLSIFARVANERGKIIDDIYSGDRASANEGADGQDVP